jgi:hypothetical protein
MKFKLVRQYTNDLGLTVAHQEPYEDDKIHEVDGDIEKVDFYLEKNYFSETFYVREEDGIGTSWKTYLKPGYESYRVFAHFINE